MSDTFLKNLKRILTNGVPTVSSVWGFLTSNPTAGIGYGPTGSGVGGTVTQLTSKVTAFTLNTMTGQITFATGALAGFATSSSATWTCSGMASGDLVLFQQISGSIGAYEFNCICSAGQGQIIIANQSSSALTETPVVAFVIIKGSTT